MAKLTKSRGYVREWMELAGLIQADLVGKLGWSKAKAHAIWHGDQRLNEDIIDDVAPLVHAKGYELLMHPEDAMYHRRLDAALKSVPQSSLSSPLPAKPEKANPRPAKDHSRKRA